MATPAELNQLYLAYFGRPPDPGGLDFYANVPIAQVINAFSVSPESVALHGSTFGYSQINAIYNNLFNRNAAPAEAQFWINAVTQPGGMGPAGAALEILKGAQNDDLAAVQNKLVVLADYVAALDTQAERNAYSGATAAAAARAFLKTVDWSPASVTTAKAAVDTQIQHQVTLEQGSGTPADPAVRLAAGLDWLLGTAGDDLFVADPVVHNGSLQDSLETYDVVDGTGGNDTLRVTLQGANYVYPTLQSVESLVYRSNHEDSVISLMFSTGVTHVAIADSMTRGTVADVGGAQLAVRNQLADATFGGITSTTLALELTRVGSSAALATVDLSAYGPSSVETLNIAASSAYVQLADWGAPTTVVNIAADGTNRLALVSGASTVATLSVSGTGSVDFEGAEFTALTQLNVGASLAGIRIALGAQINAITATAGNDAITYVDGASAAAQVSLGGGDDVLTLRGAPAAGATFAGGTGQDKLVLTDAAYHVIAGWSTADRARFTGFETLEISDALAGGTYDLSLFSGVNAFSAANGLGIGNVVTVTNLSSGDLITLTGDLSTTSRLVAEVRGAATGTADTLRVRMDPVTTFSLDGLVIEAPGLEALEVEMAAGALSYVPDLFLSTPGLQALKLTGDNILSVFRGPIQPIALTHIDASVHRAGVNILISPMETATTILGSAFADKISLDESDTATGNGGADPTGLGIAGDAFLTGDVFFIARPGAGRSFATITDIRQGDRVTFIDHGDESFVAARLTLNASATLQDYLDAAATGNGGTNAILRHFQFAGDTYLVQDNSAAGNWVAGIDAGVKLVGLHDLSTSVLAAVTESRLVI